MNNTIETLEDIITVINEESTKIGIIKIKDKDFNKTYYEIIVQKSMAMGTKNSILIIFKDITGDYRFNKSINKIKKREMTMAKLAHELKNPISTIGLITDEINHRFNERRSYQIKKPNSFNNSKLDLQTKEEVFKDQDDQSVTIIYNLCNYLMILIEDLNAFVKLNNKEYNSPSHNIISMQKIDLVDTLNFCYLIFYTKQKFDSNKQKLKVKIVYDEEVSKLKVKTNEIKLKQ